MTESEKKNTPCFLHPKRAILQTMEGIVFIILAFVLIIAEAHVPSFGLLGIAGIASLLTGGHFIIEQGGIFGYPLDWGFFLGLATAFAIPLFCASYIVAKHRKSKPVSGIEGMIDHDAKIVEWSGKNGLVHVQGELWAAHSEFEHHFAAGDLVTVSGTHDLSLRIHLKK